jgi:hypothetical protein
MEEYGCLAGLQLHVISSFLTSRSIDLHPSFVLGPSCVQISVQRLTILTHVFVVFPHSSQVITDILLPSFSPLLLPSKSLPIYYPLILSFDPIDLAVESIFK